MATQAQQTQLLTFLVGTFDAAPTAELFSLLEGALDNGATVSQLADVIVGSEYFTGVYADTDAFVANFPAALVGPFVSEEVLTAAEGIVSQWINDGASVATVISKALVALSGVDAADETWGAAAAALSNKVEVAQYFVDTVSGTGYATVAEMQAILAGVTQDAATVTTAKATADALADSINNEGSTFTLTTDADPVNGTSMNDTITAASGTLNTGDLIADAYSTDNDTLNATFKSADITANPLPTISGIENININIDAFDGTTTTLDAQNIEGATITLSSNKLGFNGTAGVEAAGDNNVTAGTNVTALTVAGLEAGVVNTGSADTVSVTTANADDVANVTVNGDVELTVVTATDVAITATAAAEVTLTAAAATDVVVTGDDVTLAVTAAQVDGDTVTGATTVSVGTAATTSLVDVDAAITLDDDFAGFTVTTADAATVTLAEAQTGTVTFAGDASNDTNSLTIATAFDLATLNVADDGLTTTLSVSDDVTVANLTATGEAVVISGEGDVTVTTTDADSIDASGLTGALEVAATTASSSITGGTGDNDVTVGDFDSSFTGQTGNDTLTVAAALSADVAGQLGAGDDTVEVSGALTGTLAVDFGAGTDTLTLADATDLSGASTTFLGLEVIEVTEGAANVTATIDSSDLTGQSYTITSADEDEDGEGLNLTVTVDGTTVDLGSLTLSNVLTTVIDASANTSATTITGTSTDDTITGSGNGDTISAGAGDDSITAGAGATTLTGGAGADTFIFVADDSTEDDMASITDFNIAQFDELDIAAASVRANTVTAVDVASVTSQSGDTVTASVTSGIMTIGGADAANIDTLAEWIDAAELVLDATTGVADALAFEFGGNTYVIENTVGDTTANVIELTGVTGLSAVATSAATDTLVIA